MEQSVGSDFYDDYISATVELDGKILKEFGNYYHDKGEERAESFAEGYAMALGIDTDSITKNNKADKPRIE